ncbi:MULTISPECIES: FkbM family methyltransferase [Burkholderia]|uniref:FkbM family methyltransferase n=2 Tax=Burkholderiaceae TaxID=119060 RepID=UPI001916C7ED|nr:MULTISPECIES: FkbM family methyltransferase [Burkholderia]MDN7533790.1 FkbM family methyltransferase [Burkholderia orbicola]
MDFSEQIQRSISARQALGADFFGGWEASDLDLFAKYRKISQGTPGYVTDYFGTKTPTDCVPWAAARDGDTFDSPPIPNDGVRAEAIEYYALLDSLENTRDDSFSMVELGSSYAPWAAIAGVLAKRQGKNVAIRAVEASAYFHALISKNLSANGLTDNLSIPKVESMAIHGAVGIRKGTVFFPIVRSAFENGGQAAYAAPDVDYVGRSVPHEEVPVRTLDEIFDGLEIIDFIHCDIQGSEGDVLIHGASQISQKVKRMFIGTHSRKIEGDLMECYHKHGWHLLRERPVTMSYRADLTSIVGMTTIDGGQYWVNSRFN